MIIDGSMDWQEVHELPAGAILIDPADGYAYQVRRHGEWPGETWLCPVSDEYAFIVRREDSARHGPRVGTYMPDGGSLELIWTPPAANPAPQAMR